MDHVNQITPWRLEVEVPNSYCRICDSPYDIMWFNDDTQKYHLMCQECMDKDTSKLMDAGLEERIR